MRPIALCLLLALLCNCWAEDLYIADPFSIWHAFEQCESKLDLIANGIYGANDSVLREKALRAYSTSLGYQTSQHPATEWAGVKINEYFFPQLKRDTETLQDAVDHLPGSPGAIDRVKLAAAIDDFYLKLTACILHGRRAIGSVSVKVHTKKSGTEVPNLRVDCIAKILMLYPQFTPTPFPNLSSPTTWDLAPGNYIMWAEDPNTGAKSALQEIPIDHDQDCDLAVP